MARWLNLFCLVVLLCSAPRAVAQDDAQEIIKKSIAAVGGAENIDKFKFLKSSEKGSAQMFGVATEFTSQTVIALPDRVKIVAKYQLLGNTYTMEQKCVGDKMSVTLNGEAVPLMEAQKAELKAAFVRTEIVRLTPLLADKAFTLKALGTSKVDGKEFAGVSVSGRGVKDVKLYFDKATSLLSHYEVRSRVGGRDVKRITTLSNYKDLQGLKRPTRMVVTLGGSKAMDVTTTEEKLSEKIDEAEFKD